MGETQNTGRHFVRETHIPRDMCSREHISLGNTATPPSASSPQSDSLKMADRKDFTITQIRNGVYLCRERFYVPGNRANIWVVQGSDADVIVDTGLGLWDLPGFLESEGLIGRHKPVQAVATHVHFDHSGGLHQFGNFAIHSSEANAIRRADNFETVTFVSDSEISKRPSENWRASSYRVQPGEPAKVVEEGDELDLGDRRLKVFHLPGHSRGSIGLVDTEARILFSGDAVYDGSMLDWLPYSDVPKYRQTCRRLQELSSEIELVCPGHFHTFDGSKLHSLCGEYASSAGFVHRAAAGCMRGIAHVVLRVRNW